MKSFETTNFGDYTSEKMQSSLSNFLKQVEKLPFFNGVLLKDITIPLFNLTPTPHKLGRKPQGFIITKRSTYGIIYITNPMDENFIIFKTNEPITFDVWIY